MNAGLALTEKSVPLVYSPSGFGVTRMVPACFHILVVEDNPDDSTLIRRALENTNIPLNVQEVRNGEEARQLLGLNLSGKPSLCPEFDLILCDLNMPKISGDELLMLARVSERWRQVAFVIFSSSDEPADIRSCVESGASAYCIKPVDPVDYIACVRAIVRTFLLAEDINQGPARSTLGASYFRHIGPVPKTKQPKVSLN